MSTRQTKMVKDGLLIPREWFQDFGQIEIKQEMTKIVIKPKNFTKKTKGMIKGGFKVEQFLQDCELGQMWEHEKCE
ncbi:MAG: hypothetical protein AB1630_09315 [bacterium]